MTNTLGGNMKRLLAICIILTFAVGTVFCAGCGDSGKKVDIDMSRFELTFEDNFDGDTLDRTKWNFGFEVEEGKVSSKRKGGFWSQDGAIVQDGNLILRTDWRENGENGVGWYSGAVMTRTDVVGENLFEQQYGYFETRCKTPLFYGGWCAFWLMPYDGFAEEHANQLSDKHLNTGVDGTEIDIFETPFAYLGRRGSVINHAVHYDGYRDYLKSASKVNIKVSDLYTEYHTYGFEWTADYYKFYVDSRLTWEVGTDGYTKNGKRVSHNIISQVKEYMLLSFEVVSPDAEGNTVGWCGDPEKNDKSKNYDFAIDYVRVYQFKD